MVTISVVLPSYNGEKYIKDSIESVINQSFQDWELILVDDCSIDSTLKIMSEYKNKDKRIKVIHNQKNQKLPLSLNAGFDMASGKYHTWTSDDNVFREDALLEMCKLLDNNPEYDVVYATSTNTDRRNGVSLVRTAPPVETITNFYSVGACFLYKKEVYLETRGYNKDFYLCEDHEFFLNAYDKGFKFYALDKNLYIYYLSDDSLSSNFRYEADNRIKDLLCYYLTERLQNLSPKEKSKRLIKFFFARKLPIEYKFLYSAVKVSPLYFIGRLPYILTKLLLPPILVKLIDIIFSSGKKIIKMLLPPILASIIKIICIKIKRYKKMSKKATLSKNQ